MLLLSTHDSASGKHSFIRFTDSVPLHRISVAGRLKKELLKRGNTQYSYWDFRSPGMVRQRYRNFRSAGMARQRYRNFKSAGWRGIVIGTSGNLKINPGGFSFCSRKNNRLLLLIHCKNGIFGGSSLKEYIEERVLSIADYIIENETTVRQTAKKFGVSKSTVHIEVTIKSYL